MKNQLCCCCSAQCTLPCCRGDGRRAGRWICICWAAAAEMSVECGEESPDSLVPVSIWFFISDFQFFWLALVEKSAKIRVPLQQCAELHHRILWFHFHHQTRFQFDPQPPSPIRFLGIIKLLSSMLNPLSIQSFLAVPQFFTLLNSLGIRILAPSTCRKIEI